MIKKTENNMANSKSEENLLVVAAAEGYAFRYNVSTQNAFDIFLKYGINTAIRKAYRTLHTQSLDESVYFAEDLIKRKKE